MNQIPDFKTKEEIVDFKCNRFPYFWGEMCQKQAEKILTEKPQRRSFIFLYHFNLSFFRNFTQEPEILNCSKSW